MSILEAHQKLVEIAESIEQAWRDTDHETTAFNKIVDIKTKDMDFSELGLLEDVPELLENPYIAALQEPSTFSDVYIKLYDNGRFYIELLNWWGSDINIHDHDFSGMQFQLRGHSLNVEYEFEEPRWSPRFTLGKISVKKAELWHPGERSFVHPGTVGMHTVSHLGLPTVSMLIRTHGTAEYGPQRNYFPPSVAGNYGVADVIFRKRVRLLRALSQGSRESFQKSFEAITSFQTDTENLFLCMKMFDILFQEDYQEIFFEFMRKNGKVGEEIVKVCAYHKASNFLLNYVKRYDGLNSDDILVCALLGCCFDQKSYQKILLDLEKQGIDILVNTSVSNIIEVLPENDIPQFFNVLRLFELEHLIENYQSAPAKDMTESNG